MQNTPKKPNVLSTEHFEREFTAMRNCLDYLQIEAKRVGMPMTIYFLEQAAQALSLDLETALLSIGGLPLEGEKFH